MKRSIAIKKLGLNKEYTLEDLKKAYRIKSKLNHPDTGGSLEEFLEIQAAYAYLKKQSGFLYIMSHLISCQNLDYMEEYLDLFVNFVRYTKYIKEKK